MGTREKYDHGVFSYVELATSDANAATAFYGRLFGWEFQNQPIGDELVYTTATKDGHRVAALYGSQQRATWLNYVTVDDVDAIAEKVTELGGKVITEPMDVMEHGRMAVVQDPQGAVFALWQAGTNIGAELVNDPGAFSWNDLQTTDVEGAVEFYGELLGWELGAVEGAPGNRHGIRVGEGMNGGIAELAPQAAEDGVPSHWLTIFHHEDIEQGVGTVRDGGGTVVVEPFDVPAGRWAIVADPQGAMFALFTGEVDP
jgi:uncharacterized protein